MDGIHQGVLGEAYVEEPQRSPLHIKEMDVAAAGTVGGGQWDPIVLAAGLLVH